MKLLAFLATLLLLAPVPAQAQSSSRGALGGVIDTLGGILGIGGGRVHGHVVVATGDTLVVRTDDNRTLSIDASQTDLRIRGLLKPGDGVTVTLRQPREGESRSQTLAAADLQLDAPSQAPKSYERVEGTVTEASGSRVVFKTREGFTLPLDVSLITGLPSLQPGQPATLIYEQSSRPGNVTAVWIEPGTGTRGGSPSASINTTGSGSGDLQRVHGLVEAVTVSGFTLAADDGRKVSVQAGQNAPQDVRPGDLVTVFGRPGSGPDSIVAEIVQPDAPRR
jgi:hypothetical protein